MPEGTAEGIDKTLTQEQANALIGKARAEGREGATKEFLKSLGFDNLDTAQAFFKEAKTLKAQSMSESEKLTAENLALSTKVTTLTEERAQADLKFRTLSLEQTAVEVGSKLSVAPTKAKQILKLLDVKVESFDPAANTLDEQFKAFLAIPENKHFTGAVELPETSGRKPGTGAPSSGAPKDKLAQLLDSFTF